MPGNRPCRPGGRDRIVLALALDRLRDMEAAANRRQGRSPQVLSALKDVLPHAALDLRLSVGRLDSMLVYIIGGRFAGKPDVAGTGTVNGNGRDHGRPVTGVACGRHSYSTVTLFARLRGWSTSQPRRLAIS